jgi:hypothetical protein
VFELRNLYQKVFPEEELQPIDEQNAETSKIYKIEYTLNLLPRLGEHFDLDPKTGIEFLVKQEHTLMELCGSTEELEVFDSKTLKQVIDFKWEAYAKHFMYLGCTMHFFYLFTISINVIEVFERVNVENNALY